MSINRTNIADHLVQYQLDMIGKTMAEAYKNENWYHEWTMTEEQHSQFEAYAIPLIKKVFRCNKRKAQSIFGWFDLSFGLRIDNEKTQNNEDLQDLEL